jgi:hypothetical protein
MMMKTINWLWLLLMLLSCAPKVYYFKPEESKVTSGDPVKLDIKVRGKAILVVHEKTASDDSANIKPGQRLMEFMLTTKKGEKYTPLTVLITTAETRDTIFLRTKDIHGDTLMAYGFRSSENYFNIYQVTSVMMRPLIIWHQDKSVVLHPGESSSVFNNTAAGGNWKIGTILSPAEKKDRSLIPTELKLLLIEKHK